MLSWLQLFANMRRRVLLAAILSEVIKMNQTMQDYSESQKSYNEEQKKLLEEISKGMEGLCYQLEAAVTSRDISGLQNLSTNSKELAGKLKQAVEMCPPDKPEKPDKDQDTGHDKDKYPDKAQGDEHSGKGEAEAGEKKPAYVSPKASGKK